MSKQKTYQTNQNDALNSIGIVAGKQFLFVPESRTRPHTERYQLDFCGVSGWISGMAFLRSRCSRGASFLTPGVTYHADRCLPLVRAVEKGEIRLEALARRGYPGRPMPARMLPEVSTLGYWDAHHEQSWGLDWHRNEGIELTYLARGRLSFAVDGNGCSVMESGTLTITRPWQQHRVGNPRIEASKLLWLILDVGVRQPNQPWQWPSWLVLSGNDRQTLTNLLRHNEQPVWQGSTELDRCFQQLAMLAGTPRPASMLSRFQLHLNELFVVLLELLLSRQPALDPRLSSSRRTVDLFLRSLSEQIERPWTLDGMANDCGLGRTRFADYCLQLTNVTPMEYLANGRIEAACRMLVQLPHRSITEIAFACGFCSSQYFSTQFHEKIGVTPREYRQRELGV
jgi:AraC-like DNA-binding protein